MIAVMLKSSLQPKILFEGLMCVCVVIFVYYFLFVEDVSMF